LETLPADVDTADSLASALASAEPGAHDLWLIDVNLPDGNGAQLLRELRRSHPDTPALAHRPMATPPSAPAWREAGFSDTPRSPLGRDQLLKAVRRALVNSPAGIFVAQAPAAVELQVQDWDETAALAALNGQRNHLIALRELFLAELPACATRSSRRWTSTTSASCAASCTGCRRAVARRRGTAGTGGAPAASCARVRAGPGGFRAAVAALLH
jgi:CheY-like chemotaxis protein